MAKGCHEMNSEAHQSVMAAMCTHEQENEMGVLSLMLCGLDGAQRASIILEFAFIRIVPALGQSPGDSAELPSGDL